MKDPLLSRRGLAAALLAGSSVSMAPAPAQEARPAASEAEEALRKNVAAIASAVEDPQIDPAFRFHP